MARKSKKSPAKKSAAKRTSRGKSKSKAASRTTAKSKARSKTASRTTAKRKARGKTASRRAGRSATSQVRKTAMKVLAGAAAGAVRAIIPPLEQAAGRSAEVAGIDQSGGEKGDMPSTKGDTPE
jgi:hypothetical protein